MGVNIPVRTDNYVPDGELRRCKFRKTLKSYCDKSIECLLCSRRPLYTCKCEMDYLQESKK